MVTLTLADYDKLNKLFVFIIWIFHFSSLSATTLLGGPTDVYLNGTMYLWFAVTIILSVPVASYVYMPIFHRLQIVSANQVSLLSSLFSAGNLASATNYGL